MNGAWHVEALQTGGEVFDAGERLHVDAPVSGGVYYVHPDRTVTFPDGTPLNQSMVEGGWRKIVVSENVEMDEV